MFFPFCIISAKYCDRRYLVHLVSFRSQTSGLREWIRFGHLPGTMMRESSFCSLICFSRIFFTRSTISPNACFIAPGNSSIASSMLPAPRIRPDQPEKQKPFEGFKWRTDPRIKLNKFKVENYVSDRSFAASEKYKKAHPDFRINDREATVWFDHIVVAKRYIGPMKPRKE